MVALRQFCGADQLDLNLCPLEPFPNSTRLIAGAGGRARAFLSVTRAKREKPPAKTSGTAAMIELKNRAGRSALCALIAAAATLTATSGFACRVMTGCGACRSSPKKVIATPAIAIRSASRTASWPMPATPPSPSPAGRADRRHHRDGERRRQERHRLRPPRRRMGGGSWTGGSCSGSWTAERRGA